MDQQILMLMIKLFMKFVIFVSSIPIATACYTSIISFGDSIADTGNMLHISSPDNLPPSAHHPYGKSYFHTPTGRYSDGRLIIDFIAENLGLPLVPPYFGAKVEDIKRGIDFAEAGATSEYLEFPLVPPGFGAKEEDLKWGVNFAVAGATAINNTFFDEKGIHNPCTNISLGVQVALFKQLLPRLCSTTPSCREFLESSLILMGEIGGNDYNFAFFNGFSLDEVKEFVPMVVSTIGSAIKELIELGAKTILVPGNLPIGCSALYVTSFNKKEDLDPVTGCINWLNDFSQYHNELLQNELHHIQQFHPNATIIYADYYNAAMRLYHSPHEFGFVERNALKACCEIGGTNNNDGSSSPSCGIVIASCCDQPSSYISWDGIHYTEAMYKWIAMAILEGPFSNPPFKSSPSGGTT